MYQEREQIVRDVYINNRIPKRMPCMTFGFSHFIHAQYAGIDPIDAQFNLSLLIDSMDGVMDKIHSDTCPIRPSSRITRNPWSSQLMGSAICTMGKGGFLQRPEVEGMYDTEYVEFIEDPYQFLCNVVIPRVYVQFQEKSSIQMAMLFSMASEMCNNANAEYNGILMQKAKEREYWLAPKGSSKMSVAPFDYLSDNIRGFTGISKDLRRHRSEIKEACDCLLPLMFQTGLPETSTGFETVRLALHMPPYMREKDFEELWFPTFKKLLEQYAARGVRASCFCENDWTRYLDYLEELPSGTELTFEYGNAQEIKDKLGHKFIIKGLYPLEILKTKTKQECLDKAKELLDIMLPGGGYIFEFDKIPVSLNDFNPENFFALSEFVYNYSHYDNAGEKSMVAPLNSENYAKEDMSFVSKMSFDWEEMKATHPLTPDTTKQTFEIYDKKIFDTMLSLLY